MYIYTQVNYRKKIYNIGRDIEKLKTQLRKV